MKTETIAGDKPNVFLKTLAVEMTDAAYKVALQYGLRDRWLDLQIDLWKAMTQTIARSHLEDRIPTERAP